VCSDSELVATLRASVARQRDYAETVLNSLPGTFYQVDRAGRLLRWNENLERLLGYGADEIRSMSALDFFPDHERERAAEAIARVFAEGSVSIEADIVHRDGRLTHYLMTGRRLEVDGEPTFVGVGTDITERHALEAALRAETTRFQAQVESSLDGILVVDSTVERVIQNRRLAELWGLSHERLQSLDAWEQGHLAASRTTDPEEFERRVGWLLDHPDEVARDMIELLDGTVIDRYSAPALDVDGTYHERVFIHRDITEERRSEQRVLYLATHDQLTGLPNRNLLGERLGRALEEARERGGHLALIDLDLDRFKVVNDGYGHPFGDRVLRAVSKRLLSLLRKDDLVTRHGGDEFLILLPEVADAKAAYLVAQKVIDGLARPVRVDDRDIHLSGSVGVSVYPQDGETADELIDNADVAMYHAKDSGRGAYQAFDRPMAEETQRRIGIETRLRGAAVAEQLFLAYQPKVELATGRIVGCEALLRWNHPELGAVPPATFIPIAEDSGLIVPIGDWVLRAACGQARSWLDAGLPPLSVAVNISARQFLQQDVVGWVVRTLGETGLPADQLELELTETLIAQDMEKVTSTLTELRELGVRIAIDDFGTGYSNLGYLTRFHVDSLKIDRSFVSGMLDERGDDAIVRAAISLAHNLGLRVVAEGVETERHSDLLREYDCDEMQGYYFSPPVPPADFAVLLAACSAA